MNGMFVYKRQLFQLETVYFISDAIGNRAR